MVIVSKETDRDQVRACTTCINMLTRNRKKEEQKQAAPPPILRYYEVPTDSTCYFTLLPFLKVSFHYSIPSGSEEDPR